MRSKRTKSKINIPRLAIPIIIAIFIILSASGFKSILNYSPEKRPFEMNQNITENTGSVVVATEEQRYRRQRSLSSGIRQATPFSAYQSIVENNIFRPLGWEERKPEPILPVVRRREIQRARPAPTYTLTLTGIAKKGKEQVALIEDSKEKDGYFLRSGEQLKDYAVSAIEDEQIILAQAGSEIRLALGEEIRYNTSGQIILTSAGESRFSMMSGASRSKAKDTQSLSVSEDKRLSIIEQMKLRRRKELDKR